MRNCPHCGKEIQDEAAFCRFCRRDVTPPLWLTSLQKCPYCAEWVERGIERCPLCGKSLTAEEPFYISEEEDSKERLLNEVRQNIFSKDQDEPELDDELEEEPPEETPAFQSIPRSIEDHRATSSDPFESQEGLGVLRERQRDQVALEPIDELPQRSDVELKPARISLPLGKIFSWLFLILSSVAIIAIAIYAFQNFDLLGSLGFGADLSPTEVVVPVPSETSEQESIATPTYAAAVLPPEATEIGSTGPCLLWSDITPAMEGQQVCAYGIIKRRFRVDNEIPYMAIFSEAEGTFAIVDRGTFYTQFRPGDCIQTEGEIELMRGVRPYIDAKNALSACPATE